MLQHRKSKMFYILIGGAIIAIILIAAVHFRNASFAQETKQELPLVSTQTIKPADGIQDYTYSGEVTGRFESQLSFQVGGKIIKRNVDIGSVVNAGELLMQLDSQDIKQSVNAIEAQMTASQS